MRDTVIVNQDKGIFFRNTLSSTSMGARSVTRNKNRVETKL